VVIAAVLLCIMSSAHADVIKWTLQDVTFDDGGTATGFFSVDTATGQLTDYEIATHEGTGPPFLGAFYSLGPPFFSQLIPGSAGANSAVTFIQFVASCGGCDQLTLLFDKNLLTRSSSVRFANGTGSGEGIIEFPGILFTRSITGGSITTTVPEPSQLTIFLVILLGLLVSRAVIFGKFRV
jgi:hypothetical protein